MAAGMHHRCLDFRLSFRPRQEMLYDMIDIEFLLHRLPHNVIPECGQRCVNCVALRYLSITKFAMIRAAF